MVFVHARNATVKIALKLAGNQGDVALFRAQQSPDYGAAEKRVRCETEMSELWSYF